MAAILQRFPEPEKDNLTHSLKIKTPAPKDWRQCLILLVGRAGLEPATKGIMSPKHGAEQKDNIYLISTS